MIPQNKFRMCEHVIRKDNGHECIVQGYFANKNVVEYTLFDQDMYLIVSCTENLLEAKDNEEI